MLLFLLSAYSLILFNHYFILSDFVSSSLTDDSRSTLEKRNKSSGGKALSCHQQFNKCIFTWTSFPTLLMDKNLWIYLQPIPFTLPLSHPLLPLSSLVIYFLSQSLDAHLSFYTGLLISIL